jgi:hypothetical protein
MAAMTLPLAGFLVSTFALVALVVVFVAVFLPARDFFSIGIGGVSFYLIYLFDLCLRNDLEQLNGQTPPKAPREKYGQFRCSFASTSLAGNGAWVKN